MTVAYIGLGSNVGDRTRAIRRALGLLRIHPEIEVQQVSSLYETEPLEYPDQNWFINAVAAIETTLTPYELLDALLDIEQQLQHKRTIRWGPRVIDLDILLYDNEIISTSKLQIPHLRMHSRAFVLIPMIEIAPRAVHPVTSETMEELYAQLKRPTVVRRYEEESEEEAERQVSTTSEP